MAATKKRAMSDSHKAALAEGRAEGRVVKNYLEALEQNRPRRGRKRTPDSIKKRLAAIENQLGTSSALQRLQLVQERMDLQAEFDHTGKRNDLSGLESAFVKTAKQYSARKGISYAAWREMGVAPEILKRAGISRSAS